MRRPFISRVAMTIANVAVLIGVGWSSYRYWPVLPREIHGSLLTGGSVVAGGLLAFGMQVFAKLDRVLTDFEKHEISRVSRIYRYIGSIRVHLIGWLISAVVALAVMAASAYLLKNLSASDPTPIVVSGYLALAIVVLATARVISAYAGLDHFRLELIRLIEEEDRRARTLKAMRRAGAVGEFEHMGSSPELSSAASA